MKKLYVLSGSSSSADAELLLSNTSISFEVVDVSERKELAAIYRDLSIGTLPAFWHEDGVVEGLGNIKKYVETQHED